MNDVKVSIGILLWKNTQYLEACLGSLLRQSFRNFELVLRDQDPEREASKFIEQELKWVLEDERVRLVSGENLMHSGGHNKIVSEMRGEYYLVGSNDMYYGEGMLGKLVEEMEKEENKIYGSAGVKLLKWNFVGGSDVRVGQTDVLDSVGLGIKRWQKVYDRGQGEKDGGQYDGQKEIFGVSGALMLVRRSALEKVKYVRSDGGAEWYDELLHYKDDTDLAYRLRWAGEKSMFVPWAKAWHDRQVGRGRRSEKSAWERENSFFGQRVMVMKNYSREFGVWTRVLTKLYALGVEIYLMVREPGVLGQLKKIKEKSAEIRRKRDMMKREVLASEIEKFFD